MSKNIEAPLELHSEIIIPDWIDYNEHLNLAYYVLIFDHATDEFLDYIGLSEKFRKENNVSTFSAEIHVNYISEVHKGDRVKVTTQLISYDAKRIHYFHRMYHDGEGYLAATNELMSLYMDMSQRRVTAMPQPILDTLLEISLAHKDLNRPEQLGHVMKVKSPLFQAGDN